MEVCIGKMDVEFLGRNHDLCGRVFRYNGKIYRGIFPEKQEFVLSLFESGFIDEITNGGLFPKTTIAEIQFEDFGLVLEHEDLSPIVTADSWSFEMLKSAALCLLKINQIGRKYGVQTIDGHLSNVVISGSSPFFIDFGSFVSNKEFPKGWFAHIEFQQFFYSPLKFYSKGLPFVSRSLLYNGKSSLSEYELFLLNKPLYRVFPKNWLDKLVDLHVKLLKFAHFQENEMELRAPKSLVPILKLLKRKSFLTPGKVNFGREIKKVNKLKKARLKSDWADYHSLSNGTELISTPRFDRIIELTKGLKQDSLVEIGGNQGLVSQLLLKHGCVNKVLCTDYDENAIDVLFNRITNANLNLTPSLLNFNCIPGNYGEVSLAEKYKSDIVMALAITHHLILTQGMSAAEIFNKLLAFTKKYVVVEFMPLGIWSKDQKVPRKTPDWYTLDWFKTEMGACFNVIHTETLEKNRILVVGEVKEV